MKWLNNIRTVFEVGANDGYAQVNSSMASWFKVIETRDGYLGIDIIEKPEKVYLNDIIYKTDIRKTINFPQHDCVLCIHVLEHIHWAFWENIIIRLWSLVKPDGVLIIGVPYRQKRKDYVHRDIDWGHKVFNILESDFSEKWTGIKETPTIEIHKTDLFRGDGVSLWWAILRKIKRVLTRHPYRKNQRSILLKWKKPS